MRNRVKVERAEHSYTQEQLAHLVNVSRQTITAIESNKYVPSSLLALKIARQFGRPMEEIFILEDGD
jgi:putative transcriptional regulator